MNPFRSTFQQRLAREARRWFWWKIIGLISWCVLMLAALAWLRWMVTPK